MTGLEGRVLRLSMSRSVCMALLLSFSANLYAEFRTTSGAVTDITTYAQTETVLVNLSSAGVPDAGCSNVTTFAIGKDISAEARARMYAMLLAAQAGRRSVVVTHDDTVACEPWGSTQNVYRRIVRMRINE